MKKLLLGFKYAARGIVHGFSERNFRVHICAVGFVSWFALRFYSLSKAEWAVLLLTFALVLAAELFNTSVERLCDKVSPERDDLIRRCKDCAAGAVLVCAVFAVMIAVVLFWDIERFAAVGAFFCEAPVRLVFLAAAVIAAAVFIFLPEKLKKH